jgi:pyruvate dehydrogenase E1 component
VPPEGAAREQRRRDVLAGGYRLREGRELTIVAMGAVIAEALEAGR